ncbi:hypothetical protein DOTSEDRAFT_71264 [Dothistroma septosporum NZE10]|uniref:Uncharacterized protein n=1 Tax=Dothistroma septosporum (strain NZE10 / CBS 128990) TaxID=675120 RepID=N1PSV3_DOTSN|nr:hypothetical protein DOTSEDRAFT_71264 [Dothistroma septosporum NZE10]
MLTVDRRNGGLVTLQLSLHYLGIYGSTLGEKSVVSVKRAGKEQSCLSSQHFGIT